ACVSTAFWQARQRRISEHRGETAAVVKAFLFPTGRRLRALPFRMGKAALTCRTPNHKVGGKP
ncbi:MAG: hypothetical protein M1582_04700, partial [Actinobacteria bacterium]|nr:hypothetical protein [Actinomycetota bacterium]